VSVRVARSYRNTGPQPGGGFPQSFSPREFTQDADEYPDLVRIRHDVGDHRRWRS
jgi:hypothetical protein